MIRAPRMAKTGAMKRLTPRKMSPVGSGVDHVANSTIAPTESNTNTSAQTTHAALALRVITQTLLPWRPAYQRVIRPLSSAADDIDRTPARSTRGITASGVARWWRSPGA